MVVSNVTRRNSCYLICALLLLVAQVALAAPGFVASSRVSGGGGVANVEINFNCKVEYLQHEPPGSSDRVRIYLNPTAICNGIAPSAAQSRGRYRPINADTAKLVDFEYDGASFSEPVLILSFSEPVSYSIEASSVAFRIVVRVTTAGLQSQQEPLTVKHRQVLRPEEPVPDFVINLASFQRIPTIADVPDLELRPQQRVFYSEADVDGSTWYRLRLGDFSTVDEARKALVPIKAIYPEAWIDQVDADGISVDLTIAANEVFAAQTRTVAAGEGSGDSRADALMGEARQEMIAGNTSRAVQIYTKVLRLPDNSRHAEAQEYLALAREKSGQVAHAKAEYQRYLSLYPDSEGAKRVGQRLAALLAIDKKPDTTPIAARGQPRARRDSRNEWRLQTFFSQYYRRDVNQQTEENDVISQSALYSDVNFDARRRGARFDFTSRVSVGYRNDFLDEGVGSGNETRISYAYADLADAKTGLRGRLGRQSRNSGGVLGRFDGLNLGYQASERILVNAVVGKPAFTATDGVDSSRTFYGASVNYGPLFDGLDLGLFYIQQDIEGIDDRRAVGGEFRYFGPNQSVWGLVDYDTLYNELDSAFLQASWRFGSRWSVHGSFDRRHSPFLSTGNALIGQPVLTFAELFELFTVDELRQFGLDRSPVSTTYMLGVSHSITPRLQINADVNETSIDATPASGGVLATPESGFRFFSTNLVASSLLKEGDVSIVGFRYSNSDSSSVLSLLLDSRYPFGRTWRINPRLRVDRRDRTTDANDEWIYSLALRVQYRRGQRFRVELEAGKQFAERETIVSNLDRESYFFNLGYQAFF